MTESSIWSEPTREQQELLRCLFTLWSPRGQWPTVQDLDRWLRGHGMSNYRARTVMDSFPVVGVRKGLGSSYSAIWYDPNQHDGGAVVRMTFAAGLHLPEFGELVESYLVLLKRCARAVNEAPPGSGPVVVNDEIAERFIRHRDHALIPTVPDMFQHEPIHFGTRMGTGKYTWDIELSDEIFTFADIEGVRSYVEKTVELVEQANRSWRGDDGDVVSASVAVESPQAGYVAPTLIEELAAVEQDAFHTGKLLGLLRELNDNFNLANPYACLMLYRAVIDCVPPVFGVQGFAAIANNIPGLSRSDKEYLRLLGVGRVSADDALHRQVRKSADLVGMHYVPPGAAMDALIRLVIDRLVVS